MSSTSTDLLLSFPISNSVCLPCSDGFGESFPQTFPVMSFIPSPSLSTSSVSILTTSTNIHSMVTRGKTSIFKPKAYHALKISTSS